MATYLYGLIRDADAARVPGVAGLQGGPVRTIRCGAIAGIASTVEADRVTPSAELIRAHDGVLRAVAEAGITALPIRFAQTFSSDDAPCEYLRDRPQLARTLETYSGCVEMHVVMSTAAGQLDWARAPSATASPETRGPGAEYLESVRAAQARRADFTLKPMLGPVVRAENPTLLAEGRGVSFAHLIQREDIEAYREAVASFPALAEAQVVGPLPLYSFTGSE